MGANESVALLSHRIDARELHNLTPLCGFISDEFSELGGCSRHRREPDASETRLHFGISDNGVNLFVEPFNDLCRCSTGRTDTMPPTCLVAWHRFCDWGHVRQCFYARRSGHTKDAELARLDISNGRGDSCEDDLYLPAEQIGVEVAAIRNVNHVDPGHHVEQLPKIWGAVPTPAEHMWILLGVALA